MQPPNEAVMWLRRGLRAVHAGDRARARRCFQAAGDADPRNIVALLWLAWLVPSREESLALFVQVLELDPRNERAHAGIRWARRRPSLSELQPPAPTDPSFDPSAPAGQHPPSYLHADPHSHTLLNFQPGAGSNSGVPGSEDYPSRAGR
jgi:tetratricopeptide (TPR) repeat protein